ncbi:MAG: hypothetical protein JWN85_3460 [Gammaproteobacteria bacterium]|nr:hypothetical protein [Gammaproteobacteria bacterium]
MRILVADRDAALLAAIASTFGEHLEIATGTGRDECIELLEQRQFALVVACDELTDYSGLELLSEVATLSPATLRLFAARPARLEQLQSRLDLSGLFGTMAYPIDARRLLPALSLARSRLQTQALRSAEPQLAAYRGTQKRPPTRTATVPTESQRAAFQRAQARRNAARVPGTGKDRALESPTASAAQPRPLKQASSSLSSVGSLAELARMAMAPGSMRNPGAASARGPRRTVFFVGTGLVAALALTAMSFHWLRAGDSVAQGPTVAAERPLFGRSGPAPLFAEQGVPGSQLSAQQSQQISAVEEPAGPDPNPPESEAFDPATASVEPPSPGLELPDLTEPTSSMMRPPSMMPSYSSTESE